MIENLNLDLMAFYMLAGMSVFGSLMILFTKNIVRAVFLLIVVFIAVAFIFMLSNAEFVGVTQILVYIGGILILMMFGIMLTTRVDGSMLRSENRRVLIGGLVGLTLLILLQNLVRTESFRFQNGSEATFTNSVTEQIGIQLMTKHILGLEIIAILLLVALVGSAYIAAGKLIDRNSNVKNDPH